jgi:hypothetical protein
MSMLDSSIDTNRKILNKKQTKLREVMGQVRQFDQVMKMFFKQHAQLHSGKMAQADWYFEDAVFENLTEEHIRRIPDKFQHSVAWLLWHMARIEDVAMNLLVAGSPQVFNMGDWQQQLGVDLSHTGNAMSLEEIDDFSKNVDINRLRDYRIAVGKRTREITKTLQAEDLKRKVDPLRIQQVWEQGALLRAASGIADYWRKRTVAGLLLMPATRHNIVHLNEALKLRKKLLQD